MLRLSSFFFAVSKLSELEYSNENKVCLLEMSDTNRCSVFIASVVELKVESQVGKFFIQVSVETDKLKYSNERELKCIFEK